MTSYEEARVTNKDTIKQMKKPAAKNKTGTTLRIAKKNFQDEELPHELFLTTRQNTNIRNDFANNMLTDMKLSKFQISKTIQARGFLGKSLGNLGKNLLLLLLLLKIWLISK